jgi:Cdc6-like AAA superfamily ATPase
MKRSKRSVLLNAFHPAKEVDDPEFFAGRGREVAALTDALHVSGSCPIIYGDRGLGKTSLAVQMRYIAMGDNELLESLKIQDRGLDETEQFITFFVTCTDETMKLRGIQGILQLLINAAEEADFTAMSPKAKANHLVERTTSRKVSLKAFEAESVKKYELEKARQSYRELSRSEKLQQLIRIITETYNRPVLFIIDELDRVRYTHGLASFIKAASGDRAKFVLVGIAANVGRLLADHQSIERSLVPVRVPTMTEGELYEIVEKAEAFLKGGPQPDRRRPRARHRHNV